MRRRVVLLMFYLLGGCAGTDRWLRPAPLLEPDNARTLESPFGDTVTIRCTQYSREKYDQTKGRVCLYQSVEISTSPFVTVTKDQRNQLSDQLISIADRNCRNFISRAFANRSGLDTTKNVLKDAATGLAAGTARTSPALSAALGFANLFTGNVVDNLNATYYLRDTFPALKTAIEAARAQQLKIIFQLKEKEVVSHSLWAALGEVQKYGDLCSFDTAISELTANSNAEKEDADDSLKAEKLAERP